MRKYVLHYEQGTSDKVYLVHIQADNTNYTVMTRWGKRSKINSLQSLAKGTFASLQRAEEEVEKLALKKVKEGYVEVTTSSYKGSVKVAHFNKYLEDDGNSGVANPAPTPNQKVVDETVELVVLCVNNKGIEERFDFEVEYIGHYTKEHGMLKVEDKYGKSNIYDKTRFKIVEGS